MKISFRFGSIERVKMKNLAFDFDETTIPTIEETTRNAVQAEINLVNATADAIVPISHWSSKIGRLWQNYQWRMRHYFYLHLFVFFSNSLLCGLIVWLIEQENEKKFIDCWFISSTCVFTCGLQTVEFSSFCLSSQIILLLFTVISGITVSTIPAILIKIRRIRRETTTMIERSSIRRSSLPIRKYFSQQSFDSVLNEIFQSLPTPDELRLKSYLILIVLILSTCCCIYLFSFLSLGFWLKYHYESTSILSPINGTKINPFYAALVISLTGFNQNGLSVWKNGLTLFVEDIFMNIIIMIVVMSGTSLFPAILRGIVGLFKSFVPWKYKIYFDYILLNNHRLSAVIFPSIQTRLYVTITILMQILGVAVALILDYHNTSLSSYSGGHRFLIFMFQTVNTRFGGYATINISHLSAATLLILILLMSIKPQMLCAINETPFEMEWILLQTQQTLEDEMSVRYRRPSIEIFLPFHRMREFLLRQGSITRAQAKQYFDLRRRADRIEEIIQNRLTVPLRQARSSVDRSDYLSAKNVQISLLRMKLFFITFCRHMVLSLFSLLTSTRTWLFIFIFLICTFESPRVTPNNPTITILRIVFEVFSAFGGCGLSMGFSLSAPSLATVLTVPSQISLILVMCMGRHRGLLDSMKDQEEIEYSAQTIIDSWKQTAIHQYQEKKKIQRGTMRSIVTNDEPSQTPPISTRF